MGGHAAMRWGGLGVVLVACAPAPPGRPADVPIAPSATAVASAPAGDGVRLDVRVRPTTFVLDGALDEWGPLASSPRPGAPGALVLTFASPDITLAADLRGGARAGAWFAVMLESDGLPPIGSYDPVNGFQPLDCDETPTDACRALVAEHAAVAARKEALAVRLFRVDAGGVRERLADGSLRDVGARSRAVATPDSLRVEATLPVTALPMTDAPRLEAVHLAARGGSAAPTFAPDDFVEVALPAPFESGLLPEVRARAFELALQENGWPTMRPGTGEVTLYRWRGAGANDDLMFVSTDHLEVVNVPLVTPLRSLGEVDIGLLFGGAGTEVHRASTVLDARLFRVEGSTVREGEVHVFSPSVASIPDGTLGTSYRAIAIGKDGTVRDDLVDLAPSTDVVSFTAFHADDWSTFGFERVLRAARGAQGRTVTVTWRYDTRTRRYIPTTRPGPRPGRPAKR